ncbi:hypothetical protein ACGF1Z_31235 [Streptomyces sp. NPDC048018]|uniref:hypothetical protein n=1 Tax=Streptomyces sp. NPDC048018 TaxID=3365499 RepID=UPI0037234B44
MSAYDDMTNADVLSADELYEMDRADEYRLDAADEERWALEADEQRDADPWLGYADGEER